MFHGITTINNIIIPFGSIPKTATNYANFALTTFVSHPFCRPGDDNDHSNAAAAAAVPVSVPLHLISPS